MMGKRVFAVISARGIPVAGDCRDLVADCLFFEWRGAKFFPAFKKRGRIFSGAVNDLYWPNTSFLPMSEMAAVERD